MLTVEQAAWLALSVQRALSKPVSFVKTYDTQYKSVFDHTQLLSVQVDSLTVVLNFYYIQQFAERIKVDAERQEKRKVIDQQESERQAQRLALRLATVEHVKSLMEKHSNEAGSTIAKYAQDAQANYLTVSI